MTYWSQLLTDPDVGTSHVPTGDPYWIGQADLTSTLNAAQQSYDPAVGNGTTDVFDAFPQVGRDIVGNAYASAVTIGLDASWITNPSTAFPLPSSDAPAIPPDLLPRWAGGWLWADTHGTLDRPSGLTITFALIQSTLSASTVTPATLLWVDDDITWTAGASPHMQGPVYDPATRAARSSAAPVSVLWPSTLPTSPAITIPISYLEAHGYQVAVTVALDMDIPSGSGTEANYEMHNQLNIGRVTFTYPQFRIDLTGRPPLAHRQRRDGTATAGPQLAHIGAAGARPPLAWRQNNP